MSNERPPMYSRLVPFKNTRTTLRPIVLVLTAFGALWSIAAAVSFFKGRSEDNTAASTKSFYLIFGILYACSAVLEVYGFAAAWTQRLTLCKIFVLTSLAASAVVTTAEIIRVVAHFSQKFTLIGDCARDEAGARLSLAQAQEYCTSKWNSGIYYRIGFLVLTALLSFFFAMMAASFYHQLKNPSSQRAHEARVAPSAVYNYPLAPYPTNTPAYDTAPPYAPPPAGFASDEGYKSNIGRGGMSATEEKELEQHRQALRDEAGWGGTGNTNNDRERAFGRSESTETVTLEPRMGNEGRV